MEWKRLARTLDLGENKHRLIVHLINPPLDDASLHNYAYKTPEPLRGFPMTIDLPRDAHITALYDLCPISEPFQRAVPFDLDGGKLKLKLPQLRFWDAVVNEYTAAAEVQ